MIKREGFVQEHSEYWYEAIQQKMEQYRATNIEIWIEHRNRPTQTMDFLELHPTYRKERYLFVDYHIVSYKLNTAHFYEAVLLTRPLLKRCTIKANGFEANIVDFYHAMFSDRTNIDEVKDPEQKKCIKFLQSQFI